MKTEYLPPLGLAIFTVVFLATAYTYAPAARAFPVPVAWVALVLIALDFRQRLNSAPGPVEASRPIRKQFVSVIWLAALAVALVLFGVLYAVPVYMVAALRFQGRRSWFHSAWISAAVTGALWLLFTLLLHLDLYPGYFFGGA